MVWSPLSSACPVLSVAFLGQAVTWDGWRDLVGFGVAISAFIAGLNLFLQHDPRTPNSNTRSKRQPGQRPADGPTAP
jgi:hypothetical protein